MTGGEFARHAGGKGANQAVAAARAGARVRFVGAVGDDDLGAAAVEALAAEGVDAARSRGSTATATGVALIAVDAEGRNQIAVASGANARVDAAMVTRRRDGASAPATSCLLGFEVPDEAVVAGARAAAAAGARAILNPAPARDLPDGACDGLLLTPNGLEAAALTGETEPRRRPARSRAARARRCWSPSGPTERCSSTAAAASRSRARGRGRRHDRRRRRASTATLAAGLAAARELEDAARRAVEAASASVRRPGARG